MIIKHISGTPKHNHGRELLHAVAEHQFTTRKPPMSGKGKLKKDCSNIKA